jgi:hypothetical protein
MDPFYFKTRLNLVELLGIKAKNIIELLKGIKEVKSSSIYFHTHSFVQQHHFLMPEPPNDFAFWITNNIGLDELAERFASIDTVKFRHIEDLREAFIEILESYINGKRAIINDCYEGEEFHFMSCKTFILPTFQQAGNLNEFIEVLNKISINSLYFHIFEARLRMDRSENDFSNWVEAFGYKDLSQQISNLDPYTMTMEILRDKIINLVRQYV